MDWEGFLFFFFFQNSKNSNRYIQYFLIRLLEIRCHLPPPPHEFRCSSPRFLTAERQSPPIPSPVVMGWFSLVLSHWTLVFKTSSVIISGIYRYAFTTVERKYDFGSWIGQFRALWRNGGKMTYPYQFHAGTDIWGEKKNVAVEMLVMSLFEDWGSQPWCCSQLSMLSSKRTRNKRTGPGKILLPHGDRRAHSEYPKIHNLWTEEKMV